MGRITRYDLIVTVRVHAAGDDLTYGQAVAAAEELLSPVTESPADGGPAQSAKITSVEAVRVSVGVSSYQ